MHASSMFVLSNVILTAAHCFCPYGLSSGSSPDEVASNIRDDLAKVSGIPQPPEWLPTPKLGEPEDAFDFGDD